jgi:predicted AlkP superfamily phosphohydrolase/phosphomutase
LITSFRKASLIASLAIVAFSLFDPPDAHAYIGPGAGFAFVSSFFAVIAAFLLAFLKLLTWPFRWTIRAIRFRKVASRSKVRRVVVLGLDGQDPELTDRFLAEGILPNFSRLKKKGSYIRLDTSFPAESPVAWSCFQTGCNPGRHKVFDFLVPNTKNYLPELCSAKVMSSPRTLRIGKYRIPLGQPTVDLGRKSQSFWKILGQHGVFSSVIRVPITFPPEKFYGTLLSAMCVPDLKGSQGTFSYYSSEPGENARLTGGIQIPVEVSGGVVRSYISGPDNSMIDGAPEIRIPFEARLNGDGSGAEMIIGKKSYPLKLREFTPWIPLTFRPGLWVGIRGICRFYLKEVTPHFKLYMTPINVDPDKPALPISHPFTYAIYLSKTQGRYSTLGLAEDTWGLNERVLDEEAFLKLAYLIHEEREKQFFDALEKTRRGAVVCVFDITDRLQHMFFRYLEPDHPANRGKDTERYRDVIRDLYMKADDLVGRTMDSLEDDTALMVMSDHGFKLFRRGVNLNSWLHQNGYLELRGEPNQEQWYQNVDWSKTRAYAVGLGGIYLNTRGRMPQGIVEPGEEAKQLRQEIGQRLRGLRDDEEGGAAAVAEVYDCTEMYKGPYVREAPDLFVGFSVGYRASWGCATGIIPNEIFEDNTKSWSGDHCMNPPDVPGILFCNRKLAADRASIMDIGPTVLDLFGVPVPFYCDGKALEVAVDANR